MSTISTFSDSFLNSFFDTFIYEETLGKIVQTTTTYVKTVVAGTPTFTIPLDGSPPLNIEGLFFFNAIHTPILASNLLDIFVVTTFSTNAANAVGSSVLFSSLTPNALAASNTKMQIANFPDSIAFHTRYAPNTTSPITFFVRGGVNGVATVSLNGILGLPIFGNVPTMSGIKIYEIEP